MRNINRVVLHCTATQPSATVQSILNYWKNVKKWKSVGYHWIIEPCGNATCLSPIQDVTNGARGFNSDSLHVSYIGGVDEDNNPKDTRTQEQKDKTLFLLKGFRSQFKDIEITGHRDLKGVNKACPSFDVKEWLKHVKL
tara:strand:+ start:14502 stop:14918 length:417 start_codon:yes stop_codon:yes gene_type:complete